MTDLNKGRELEAQIETFKKEAMELWFVPNLADTYKNKDLFIYSIIDGEVFFMREQARQLWSFWNKAKAQAVPEGYCLVPKEIPDSVVSCLENSGFHWGDGTRDHYTPIYSLMVEVASESGAEG
ncbi:hypothetical protein ACTZ9G_001776 [Acinetobacter baumannii]|uniref:Uncharacterized protein n=1 Tax=Acinetobacter baumannii 1499986 TaxID=1310673 RepID=A0A836YL58_ACIBA|nr:hypothetical protein [Acinetobacter baumannii]EXB28499.1 hypothetical protein J518_3814 [Acinetobacter baumannii 1419130]EXC17207.1 hypothetical protein J533_1495 [Acinetobacter baumannii 4749]EXC37746.1 hypothetical protein J552_2784 [Acinetobacter baumannii 951631]EXG11565.1 hypothetical protein J712_1526 [Acinetobacter baumannii 722310]EXG26885.1 hypothetical protein J719_1874 [Acinetobacter baumannii 323408]